MLTQPSDKSKPRSTAGRIALGNSGERSPRQSGNAVDFASDPAQGRVMTGAAPADSPVDSGKNRFSPRKSPLDAE